MLLVENFRRGKNLIRRKKNWKEKGEEKGEKMRGGWEKIKSERRGDS